MYEDKKPRKEKTGKKERERNETLIIEKEFVS